MTLGVGSFNPTLQLVTSKASLSKKLKIIGKFNPRYEYSTVRLLNQNKKHSREERMVSQIRGGYSTKRSNF